MRRRTLVTAALVVVLMLAVKLALVFSLADVFFYGEELEKGTAAKAMLDGLRVPHHTLAYHYYEGGGFTISHLTALAFRLVGQNLLAHKLVSLGSNVAILLIGFAFVRRNWGLAAAAVFGVLFAFAPPGVQKNSLLNLGIHYESLFFLLLLLHLGTRVLFDEEVRPRTVFGFGLAAGFGAFFSYQTLPVTAFLVGLVVVLRRDVLGRGRELVFGWGALVGAAPLLWMWRAVGNEVFDIHGTNLLGGGEETSGNGIDDAGTFLYSLLVGGGPLQHLRFLAAIALPVVGLAVVARKRPDRPEGFGRGRRVYLVLAGYAAFYSILYLNSPFVVREVQHHFHLQRTMPFWMMGTCLASATVGTLMGSASGKVRVQGWLCALALAAYGVQGTVQTIAAARPGLLAANTHILTHTKGYAYAEYFAKFLPHLPGNHEDRLAVALQFDEPDRSLLRAEIASALYAKSDRSPEEIVDAFKRADPEHWQDFLPGLGPYFFRAGANNMEIALRVVLQTPPQLRPTFLEGLGRRGLRMRAQPEALALELDAVRASGLPLPYFRGFGQRVFLGFRLDPEGALDFLATVPEDFRPIVARGYEVARTQWTFPADDSP